MSNVRPNQTIREALEANLIARLGQEDCDTATMKVALDYLKLYPIDDFDADETIVLPRKGITKKFADRL